MLMIAPTMVSRAPEETYQYPGVQSTRVRFHTQEASQSFRTTPPRTLLKEAPLYKEVRKPAATRATSTDTLDSTTHNKVVNWLYPSGYDPDDASVFSADTNPRSWHVDKEVEEDYQAVVRPELKSIAERAMSRFSSAEYSVAEEGDDDGDDGDEVPFLLRANPAIEAIVQQEEQRLAHHLRWESQDHHDHRMRWERENADRLRWEHERRLQMERNHEARLRQRNQEERARRHWEGDRPRWEVEAEERARIEEERYRVLKEEADRIRREDEERIRFEREEEERLQRKEEEEKEKLRLEQEEKQQLHREEEEKEQQRLKVERLKQVAKERYRRFEEQELKRYEEVKKEHERVRKQQEEDERRKEEEREQRRLLEERLTKEQERKQAEAKERLEMEQQEPKEKSEDLSRASLTSSGLLSVLSRPPHATRTVLKKTLSSLRMGLIKQVSAKKKSKNTASVSSRDISKNFKQAAAPAAMHLCSSEQSEGSEISSDGCSLPVQSSNGMETTESAQFRPTPVEASESAHEIEETEVHPLPRETPAPIPPDSPPRPKKKNIVIEIQPGFALPLIASQDTMQAVADGFVLESHCTGCSSCMNVRYDCDFVVCPVCRTVSPVEDGPGAYEYVGLGLIKAYGDDPGDTW